MARSQHEHQGICDLTGEQSPAEQADDRPGRVGWFVIGMRYVLPVAVTLAGAIVMALGGENNLLGGAGIVSAGLAIYASNWLYRASVEGDRVRVQEEEARIYLDVHGHWPDESPGPQYDEAQVADGRSPSSHPRSPDVSLRHRKPVERRGLQWRSPPRR
jgi:hypothetical protein